MNLIHSLILSLWILLVGIPTPKNSLHKKPTKKDLLEGINCWVERNFYIIALAAIVFLLIVFVITCFLVVGFSATESGLLYNHFQEVI